MFALLATLYPLQGEPATAELSTLSPDGADLQKSLDKSGERRAPLSLVVDGVPKAANIIVILRATDVLVKETDLIAATVPLPGARFVEVGGDRYVSLASLAPQTTYTIDMAAIALDLAVAPALLGHTDIAVTQGELDRHSARADPSGFLTYSLSDGSANLRNGTSGFVQAGAGSAAAGLFTASGSYSEGEAHRGLFAYQRESEQNLSRLTIGDEYASSGNLGANVVVGGFGATRHFEFQPDYAYFPSPGLHGTILSPTTADIYVNGTLVRSVHLSPGAFDLSGIPVQQGAGVTEVVLRDAYGNTQTLSGNYYQSRQLLRKGLTDYDYHVGFVRPNPFGSVDAYGPLSAIGEYRLGVTNGLTAGARFERTAGISSGGPLFDVALPFGHVSLESAASDAFGKTGRAFGAAYDYFCRRFGIDLSVETQSANYSTASLAYDTARQRSNVRESFGLPISSTASFNVSNSTTTYTGFAPAAQFVADLTVRPPRRPMYFTLKAERDTGGSIFGFDSPVVAPVIEPIGLGAPILAEPRQASPAVWTFGVEVTFINGRTSNVSVAANDTGGVGSTTVAINKAAPIGPGFGYNIEGTTGADRSAAAQVSYQTQYGNIQTFSDSGFGPSTTSVTLAGALVAFRQGAFFTAPVNGSYTLVNVPGFMHLPVFFNSQYAGRTDRRGRMVIPNLSPYYENRVGIDELLNRLDLTEDASVEDVRPKNLSGVVSVFTIHHFHAFSGHIIVHRGGKTIVPVLGQIVLERAGIDYQSDLGREGQFYVENLEPGRFGATVTTTDGLTCAFKVNLVADSNPVTSVGTFVCDAAS